MKLKCILKYKCLSKSINNYMWMGGKKNLFHLQTGEEVSLRLKCRCNKQDRTKQCSTPSSKRLVLLVLTNASQLFRPCSRNHPASVTLYISARTVLASHPAENLLICWSVLEKWGFIKLKLCGTTAASGCSEFDWR